MLTKMFLNTFKKCIIVINKKNHLINNNYYYYLLVGIMRIINIYIYGVI